MVELRYNIENEIRLILGAQYTESHLLQDLHLGVGYVACVFALVGSIYSFTNEWQVRLIWCLTEFV